MRTRRRMKKKETFAANEVVSPAGSGEVSSGEEYGLGRQVKADWTRVKKERGKERQPDWPRGNYYPGDSTSSQSIHYITKPRALTRS